jgi:uncharacterized membrane protein YkvA (DUF1232 family)
MKDSLNSKNNNKDNLFSRIEEIVGDQEVERWQSRAKEYVDNPAKTEGLITKAIRKAENNKHEQVLNNIWNKIHLLFALVRDWTNGDYRRIAKSSIIAIMAGLIYFVSPLDIVPDWIIGLGFVDDAAILGLIINQLDKELVKYEEWKGIKTI